VIARTAAPLPPDEAARRAARGRDPVWLSSPGAGPDVGIALDVVAAEPWRVVRGGSLGELEAAWAEARRRWAGAPQETPVGIGWLSYDLARRWVPLPGAGRADDPGAGGSSWSDLEFRFFDALWMRAVGAAEARIVAADPEAAQRLAALLGRAAAAEPAPRLGPLRADAPSERYTAAVARIKEYLVAGDAYQVNLARRLSAALGEGDPLWLAATLRRRAPAPHAVWIGGRSRDGGPIDRQVVGNSPERFLRLGTGGDIETRPIKGTRARGDAGDDAAARAALLGSAKDRAEHVMIVDLERNDLGRVAVPGSVAVEGLLRVLELPALYHLVTTVRARLRPGVGLAALVEATFPGGSITGAPKRRAMEIIDELEPARRGIYTGATGWLGAAGDLDLAVAIRTATVEDGRLTLGVGGGIVADSEPADELAETEVKARAFRDLTAAS
jgi:para-aminobenzoate synthetase component I